MVSQILHRINRVLVNPVFLGVLDVTCTYYFLGRETRPLSDFESDIKSEGHDLMDSENSIEDVGCKKEYLKDSENSIEDVGCKKEHLSARMDTQTCLPKIAKEIFDECNKLMKQDNFCSSLAQCYQSGSISISFDDDNDDKEEEEKEKEN